MFSITEHADECRDETQKALYGFSKYNFDPDTLKKLVTMVEFLEELVNKGDIFNRYG